MQECRKSFDNLLRAARSIEELIQKKSFMYQHIVTINQQHVLYQSETLETEVTTLTVQSQIADTLGTITHQV